MRRIETMDTVGNTVKDKIIIFDVRGTCIKTYESTIRFCDSAFFRGILGINGIGTTPQADGSFFVDCNPDIFYWIIGYLETGVPPTNQFDPVYIGNICAKFDVPLYPHTLKHRISEEVSEFLNKFKPDKPVLRLEFFCFNNHTMAPEIVGRDNTIRDQIEWYDSLGRTMNLRIGSMTTLKISGNDFRTLRATEQSKIFNTSYFGFMGPLQEKHKLKCSIMDNIQSDRIEMNFIFNS